MSTASDDSVPDGTTPDTGASPDATSSDVQPAVRQEHEIEVIRDHLGDLLGELGVRRDKWRPSHILRRLPIPFLLLGLGAVGLGVLGEAVELEEHAEAAAVDRFLGPGPGRETAGDR